MAKISEGTRAKWRKKVSELLDDENVSKLSNFEEEFIPSLSITLNKGYDLSHKQSKCLNRVYERVIEGKTVYGKR